MINPNNLYIDVSLLQSLPPSNINRDDMGSPKSCKFGGTDRARVSSQSWKYATRQAFKEHIQDSDLGVRALDMGPYIAQRVQKLDPKFKYEDAIQDAGKIFKTLKMSTGKSNAPDKHLVLKSILFLSDHQVTDLAQAIIDGNAKDKKVLKAIMQKDYSVDLALFGRMVAGDTQLNVDASSQVSQAISVNSIQKEHDFFTANLDFNTDESSGGAGMMGNTEFTSGTFYRYANVAGHQLLKQLNGNVDQTIKTLQLFIKAFTLSMPSGHVTSFAQMTLPKALVISVRDDRPVNLVNAFEKPVTAHDDQGYTEQSVQRLAQEYRKDNSFLHDPKFTLTIGMDELIGDGQDGLDDLLANFAKKIKPFLS